MWIIFSIFAILWFVGIDLYFPPTVSMLFFSAMLISAVVAVWKVQPATLRRK
jgi:hypothetical protein